MRSEGNLTNRQLMHSFICSDRIYYACLKGRTNIPSVGENGIILPGNLRDFLPVFKPGSVNKIESKYYYDCAWIRI